jgi:hypothetical protein
VLPRTFAAQNFSPSALVVNSTSGTIARHAMVKSPMNAGPQTCLSLNATDTTKSFRLMSSTNGNNQPRFLRSD